MTFDSRTSATEVHPSVYSDREIFDEEIERIWERLWIYIGHDSEVDGRGDFVTRAIGPHPVVLHRAHDGGIMVFHNQCPSCGELLIRKRRGGLRQLRCSSCGVNGTMPGGPAGPVIVARVDSHQGFVFASMAPTGDSLHEHLGHALPYFDKAVQFSPSGRIRVVGELRTVVRANWKQPLENACEGYHAVYLHRSVFGGAFADAGGEAATKLRLNEDSRWSIDLGRGHAVLAYAGAEQAAADSAIHKLGLDHDDEAAYVEALGDAWGEDRARQILDEGMDHLAVFPNMALVNQDIRTFTPLAPDRTIISQYLMVLEGVPASLNTARRRFENNAYGPAGMIGADDLDVFERVQFTAPASTSADRMVLTRGLQREQHLDDGRVVGKGPDEAAQRALWRYYDQLLAG